MVVWLPKNRLTKTTVGELPIAIMYSLKKLTARNTCLRYQDMVITFHHNISDKRHLV
jgi:hypothetical protein